MFTQPRGWFRVGRGRELHFFALDDELDRWIMEGLPQEFAPYRQPRNLLQHNRRIVITTGLHFTAVTFDQAAGEVSVTSGMRLFV